MCTVTFLPRHAGYALAMNRDEKLMRPAGLRPVQIKAAGWSAIFPREPGGGTWIALNDSGATLALINWYAITTRVAGDAVSRGEVVKAAMGASSGERVEAALGALPLRRINPFRLVGIFPGPAEVFEWCWSAERLMRRKHGWTAQQWISSGYDEPGAQRARGAAFQCARRQKDAGGLAWLRRLHRSHVPERGPYSTCMHRADAATVSYTEIIVRRRFATLRYHLAAPCQPATDSVIPFPLRPGFEALRG
jgi:hypothetical protein